MAHFFYPCSSTGLESADETEQNRLRRQLFQELSGLYEIMKTYDFRQLHFHDRHNISYQRFHRPDTFGDDLTGIRYSVEYVNREKKKIAGFEEGRIVNGYRYVYPLLHQDEHIGSVELSISMENIIRKIHQIFGQEVQFLLLKSQIEKIMKIDHLTKADTRGVLMEKITAEHQRYLRYKRPYSISIIDIDHFKKINDSYGHLAGDDVLRTMADLVKNHLRSRFLHR